jgi:hypothetical protein
LNTGKVEEKRRLFFLQGNKQTDNGRPIIDQTGTTTAWPSGLTIAATWCGKPTPLLSRFHIISQPIILPRQAQDKHRQNSKKDAVFRTAVVPRLAVVHSPAIARLS